MSAEGEIRVNGKHLKISLVIVVTAAVVLVVSTIGMAWQNRTSLAVTAERLKGIEHRLEAIERLQRDQG